MRIRPASDAPLSGKRDQIRMDDRRSPKNDRSHDRAISAAERRIFQNRNRVVGQRRDSTIVSAGTFNFWIDPESASSFEPGNRCRWAKFTIGSETCVLCSDGPSLAATIGMGTPDETQLFRVAFAPSFRRRHMVTVGWKKGRLRVFLDAKPIVDVALPE